ncbi:hypothetical protein ACN6K5_003702 [Streptomyces violaceoruber]|uniref:hypothetical protein n=1 Tax=Streptomyces violaceoruber group TaxID=2867121 RepID=UPI0033CE1A14
MADSHHKPRINGHQPPLGREDIAGLLTGHLTQRRQPEPPAPTAPPALGSVVKCHAHIRSDARVTAAS